MSASVEQAAEADHTEKVMVFHNIGGHYMCVLPEEGDSAHIGQSVLHPGDVDENVGDDILVVDVCKLWTKLCKLGFCQCDGKSSDHLPNGHHSNEKDEENKRSW